MPITPGDQLGHYKILSLIGKGGMGEVYRALDSKLEREVAIKVLPAALANDPERLTRFEREAKVLAQLNHPGIAAIHGVEDRALVMELVPGPTLADRIKQGPIPPDEAETIFLQIADALEYAHERGVIHRDLKPANIKIDLDDKVKILDFGLAKALSEMSSVSSAGDPTDSPTVTMGGTIAGTILGTAAYMAPEQARGKKVDRRADIWASGVVLWETLTGERLFKGEDTVQVLSNVLQQPVDLSCVPARFHKLLTRCLDRNPKDRLRDIGEARFVLQGPDSQSRDPEEILHQRLPAHLPWVWPSIAAALGVALAALSFFHFRETPAAIRSVRFQIPNPDKVSIREFALSPDGRYLAFINDLNGRSLWIRALDTLEAHPLPGTEGALQPFWSPNSDFIGFFAQNQMKKVAVTGGPPFTLCEAANPRGGTWSPEGIIIFSESGDLFHVPAGGGAPVKVPLRKSVNFLGYPEFLPDGHFLFTSFPGGIFAASLPGDPVHILTDTSSAVYSPPAVNGHPGYILFLRQNTLMALPFDAGKLHALGDVFPIADQVGQTRNNSGAYSKSSVGILAYGSGFFGEGRQLAWVDRSGKRLGLATKKFQICCNQPVLSRDETRAAFPVNDSAGVDVWLADLVRGTSGRFTFNGAGNATWSPDGLRLAFAPRKGASSQIFVKPANGASNELLLAEVGAAVNVWDWSADGKFLAFTSRGEKTQNDIWLLPVDGDHKPVVYLRTEFDESAPAFSPDGRWMAYISNESGMQQIWLQSIPAGAARYQISTAGGAWPVWRRDGKELFYLEGTKLIAVPMRLSPTTAEAGKPAVLFDGVETRFQPSHDGTKFLVNVPAEGATSNAPPVTILTNWQAALGK